MMHPYSAEHSRLMLRCRKATPERGRAGAVLARAPGREARRRMREAARYARLAPWSCPELSSSRSARATSRRPSGSLSSGQATGRPRRADTWPSTQNRKAPALPPRAAAKSSAMSRSCGSPPSAGFRDRGDSAGPPGRRGRLPGGSRHAVMDAAEQLARERGTATLGITVGLFDEYGPAQRLYGRRGYVPDGRGACQGQHPLSEGLERGREPRPDHVAHQGPHRLTKEAPAE